MADDDDWAWYEAERLHHAAEADHCELATWLVARGADVNANEYDKIGETPLSLAVPGSHPDMVELLRQRDADPDIGGWLGLTARTTRTDKYWGRRAHPHLDHRLRTAVKTLR